MPSYKFQKYRTIADKIEDRYFGIEKSFKTIDKKISYLENKYNNAKNIYFSCAYLDLLCHELRVKYALYGSNNKSLIDSIDNCVSRLVEISDFNPLSIISSSTFYLNQINHLDKAKTIAIYAAFIAENNRAFVRHAYQNIIRIANADGDFELMKIAALRLVRYNPPSESPDPGIERDVVNIIKDSELSMKLKDQLEGLL